MRGVEALGAQEGMVRAFTHYAAQTLGAPRTSDSGLSKASFLRVLKDAQLTGEGKLAQEEIDELFLNAVGGGAGEDGAKLRMNFGAFMEARGLLFT